jgi:hypothetical protein
LIEIRGQIARKLKFWGQLGAKLKKIRGQGPICKRRKTMGIQLTKTGGEIEEIESLMVN